MTTANEFKDSLVEGPIKRKMITFAVPIFLGNLFQQLYNTADSLIVGNFLGSQALASVAATSHLVFLLVGFFQGMFIGAGVVVARFYGAKDVKTLRQAVHTTTLFGIFCGVFLTVAGMLTSPALLRLMKTPADIIGGSITYLLVYYAGSLGFVLYNCFVGIMQSVGDSRHPLYYLIFSSLLNIILDLFFIAVLGYGVGSAAFATILSQFISAILCLYRLMKKSPDEYRVSFRELRISRPILKEIVRNGLPAGLQNSIISIANVFVQSNINIFGSAAVAGIGAYGKLDGFAFLPVTSFSMAITTFVSQNIGAGRYDRVKKGSRFGVLAGMLLAAAIGMVLYISIPVLLKAFTRDPEAIAYGIRYARITTLFFFECSFNHCMAAVMRGWGKSAVPMYVMMLCWCVLRVSYISVITRYFHKIEVIAWAYPLTWTVSGIIFILYYLLVIRKLTFEREKEIGHTALRTLN